MTITDLIKERGLVNLAKSCNVTYQAIRKWEKHGVPTERVLQVVNASGRKITPYQLRPDIYPDPNWMPPEQDLCERPNE